MKSAFLFLYVLLFSTTIQAKVEVLCLGEGECVSLENYIHAGSLSHASLQQRLDYIEFLIDHAAELGLDIDALDLAVLADAKNGDVQALNRLNDFSNNLAQTIYNYLNEDPPELPVGEGEKNTGWFDVSTLKEPYRIEGKKTMGIELAEQLNWTVPDIIFYPTGGGTGLIGMWKAFAELEAIGWIGSKRPRMVAVQAKGCAPIVKAYEDGVETAERWEDAYTIASGIRVPAAVGDFLILRAVRDSGGFAIAVDDQAIELAQVEVAHSSGLLMGPEGAATYAAYKQAVADGRISKNEQSVLFNCGTALKYPMPPASAVLDRTKPIDYRTLITSAT